MEQVETDKDYLHTDIDQLTEQEFNIDRLKE